MRAPERPTTARRSPAVPLCAVYAAWFAAFGLFVGCLNPMPDDFPSERDDDEDQAVTPPRDGTTGSAGEGGLDNGPDDPVQLPDPSAPGPAGSADAGAPVGDAGTADAGSDAALLSEAGPGDAAPDAGASEPSDAGVAP